MGTKRPCTDDFSNSYNSISEQFPRFLVITSLSDTKKVTELSPFVIDKTIQSVAGHVKSVKKMRSGDLLVEVERKTQSNNLTTKLKKILDLNVACTPHRSLNSSRGVIRCIDLKGLSDEEIIEGLKEQGITNARRIKITKEGRRIETNTIILTFNSSIIPKTIKVGYLQVNVEIYIPNPLQCYRCFRFGHDEDNCSQPGDKTCPKCAQSGIDFSHIELCTNEIKCRNCGNSHSARSKECSFWKKEKEILRIKYTQNITFPEAKKIFETMSSISTASTTYASVTRNLGNCTCKCTCQQPNMTITEKSTSKPVSNTTTSKPTSNVTLNLKAPTDGGAAGVGGSRGATVSDPVRIAEISTEISGGSVGADASAGDTVPVTVKPRTKANKKNSPKEKIKLDTGRIQKGSDDPIQAHNRFEALSGDSESVMEITDEESRARPHITRLQDPAKT